MGKIVICSNKRDSEYLIKNFEAFGFRKACSINEDYGVVCAFKKQRVETNNYASIGDDYAIGVGTFIYDRKTDSEALLNILQDLKYMHIQEIRERILGSFAIFIKNKNGTIVFVDKNNTYNLYYSLNNGELVLTNTYYHVARVIGAEVDKPKMIERIFKFSNLGNETPFVGVKKLMGNQCLSFDTAWRIKQMPGEKITEPENIWPKVSADFSGIDEMFRKPASFMTGGQDSRLCLAIMMNQHMKPKLCYGIGDSIDTWTKPDDENIVKEIAKEFELDFVEMNWKQASLSYEEIIDYTKKYGEQVLLYGGNKNIFEYFETVEEIDFIGFGYFGEIYRNVESIENYNKREFTLAEYIEDVYLDNKLKKSYSNYKDLFRSILERMISICEEKSIDYEHMTKCDHQKIDTEYRKSADTVMNNFANMFVYSAPFLAEKVYTDSSELMEYSKKNNSKYILEGIKYLQPRLMDISFFSHSKKKKYDEKTGELEDQQKNIELLNVKIKQLVKNKKLLSLMRSIYKKLSNDQKGSIELRHEKARKEVLLSELKSLSPCLPLDHKQIAQDYDSPIINSILMYENMIDEINRAKEKDK